MNRNVKFVCVPVLFLFAAAAGAQDFRGYAGKGGMGAYKIEPHVYEYHYDHGFTGEDAMGWDPDLQFAWSRLAAAEACGIDHEPASVAVDHLVKRFGQSETVHEMVGIGFHAAQMRSNPAFCTEKRKAEVTNLMPDFDRGVFPVPSAVANSPVQDSAKAGMASSVEPAQHGLHPTDMNVPSEVQAPAVALVSTALQFPLSYRVGTGENGRNSGDDVLRVVRRAHTGRAVGLQVLTGALLGGVGGVGFGKARLHGEKIKTIQNPGQELLQVALRSKLDGYFSAHPDAMPREPVSLHISGHDWLLIYQELDNSSTAYELRYGAHIQGASKKIGFMRAEASPIALQCEPTPRTAPLEQWEKDDYAAVKVAAAEYAEQCAADFEKKLATWFPMPPAA